MTCVYSVRLSYCGVILVVASLVFLSAYLKRPLQGLEFAERNV